MVMSSVQGTSSLQMPTYIYQPAVRDAPSVLSFRSRLKTWLFELTLAWHWPHSPAALHFVFVICYFNNSVKCPCNVIHDSVTLIFTFLIIIIIITWHPSLLLLGAGYKYSCIVYLQRSTKLLTTFANVWTHAPRLVVNILNMWYEQSILTIKQ